MRSLHLCVKNIPFYLNEHFRDVSIGFNIELSLRAEFAVFVEHFGYFFII